MIKSWSFSRYATFEQCPYRLKLQVIDKIPDKQPKKAADRGTAIHTMAEVFTAEGGELPSELSAFSDEFSALHTLYREGKVSLEGEWGFTNNWEPCAYNDAWLKVKADAVVFTSQTKAVVIDHKTGKRFGNEMKHNQQLQLYSLSTLIRRPEIEEVRAELWYLDQDELADMTMKRSQLGKYLKIWDAVGQKITSETEFKPKPNIISCKYCPYHRDRQGDCKFGV